MDELSRYCRPTTTVLNTDTEQINIIHQPPRIKTLSNAQRIRKVIFELVETERSYVQVSNNNERISYKIAVSSTMKSYSEKTLGFSLSFTHFDDAIEITSAINNVHHMSHK